MIAHCSMKKSETIGKNEFKKGTNKMKESWELAEDFWRIEMNANELAEQLDEYAGNSGYSHNDYADSMSQAATMLRQQQAEIEALKEDGKKLDWIWKQASKISGGGVFQIKGIELFTVVTQHIINTKGIRELLDSAMEIDAREKASKR